MINESMLLLCLFTPTLLGFLCTRYLLRLDFKAAPLMLSFSYAVGIGLITHLMFVLSLFNTSFSLLNLYLGISVLCMFFIVCSYFIKSKPLVVVNHLSSFEKKNLIINILLILIIGLYTYIIIIRNAFVPIQTWDAFATIAYKAKVFFHTQSIGHLNELPHPAYPLLTPLVETWTALHLDEWNESLIKLLFSFTYISFMTIIYFFLRSHTSATWALVGCALLLSSNLFVFHASCSYRDFHLMYYNCLAVISLLMWHKHPRLPFMALAAVMAGFATFVKVEGSLYLAVLCMFCFLICTCHPSLNRKEKAKSIILFGLISVSILALFLSVRFLTHVPLESKADLAIGINYFERILPALNKLTDVLFNSGSFGLTWILFAFSLLQYQKLKEPNTRALLMALSLYFLCILAISIFTSSYKWMAGDLFHTTLPRIILHFFPLAVISTILINGKPSQTNG